MARIRSVHPGLFTDEAFVVLSADAQMFLIGLWTEADDQGVFEWKPTTLRMRLRATKDGSVDGLLAEIEAADCIKQYEIGGRKYGAVRNFRKYQRPKFPKAVHPITDEIRIYVSLTASPTEIDGDDDASFPRNAEIPPQREEGGGSKGKKEYRRGAKATAPEFDEFWKVYPKRKGDKPRKSALKAFEAAVRAGANPNDIIAGVKLAAARNADKIGTEFIPQAVKWLHDERWKDHLAKPDTAATAEIDWPPLVEFFMKTGTWPRFAGPQPGFSGCRVPIEILREHGYLPRDAPSELKLVSA